MTDDLDRKLKEAAEKKAARKEAEKNAVVDRQAQELMEGKRIRKTSSEIIEPGVQAAYDKARAQGLTECGSGTEKVGDHMVSTFCYMYSSQLPIPIVTITATKKDICIRLRMQTGEVSGSEYTHHEYGELSSADITKVCVETLILFDK